MEQYIVITAADLYGLSTRVPPVDYYLYFDLHGRLVKLLRSLSIAMMERMPHISSFQSPAHVAQRSHVWEHTQVEGRSADCEEHGVLWCHWLVL